MRARLSTNAIAAILASAGALLAVWNLTRPPFADRYGVVVLAVLCVFAGYLVSPGARRRIGRGLADLGAGNRHQDVDDYLARRKASPPRSIH